MKKLIATLFFIIFTYHSFAQGEANIWYFGENAGLEFNTGSAIALNNGQLNTREGCSSFSTSLGELLFYSDGTTIWNKNHTPMPNGVGLKGHPSSTQSAMIIPKPKSSTEYFIFTVGARVGGVGEFGFNYYTIDMNADGGLGDVIAGPIDLTEGRFNQWTEKVAAIKGDECNTFWVVSYAQSDFYAYKVSSSGVATTPVKTNVSFNPTDRRGYLKISPNGKKLAIAHMSQFVGNTSTAGSLLLYDFNDATGKVSNQKKIILDNTADRPYGVEFSSNSEKLYVHASNDFNSNDQIENNDPNNHYSVLYQFDLSSNLLIDINASKTIIDSRNLYRGALQLGPDQKIYRTLSSSYNNGTPFLGIIENPENDGLASNYKHSHINLGGNNSTQGLPPFIASIFDQIEITNIDNGKNTILNNQTVDLCEGDNFKVSLESLAGTQTYEWYKNDSNTLFSNVANLSFPSVSITDNGKYSLKVAQTDKCGITSILEGEFEIKVHSVPVSKQPISIQECDNDLDGFLTFNLKDLKDNEILNGQNPSEFEVIYFTNQTDADNYEISNAITNPYTNSSPFSKDNIVARIQNKNNTKCYETKSFSVEVYESPNPPNIISTLGICDSNLTGTDIDELEIFDLTQIENEILNGQSASDFTIQFYTDNSLNSEITAPTSFSNTSRVQPIYVKITNNYFSNCTVTTNFNIEVFQLPSVTNAVPLKQCDDDNDGFSFFNLNEANSKISSNFENETFTYFSSFNSANTNDKTLEIENPTSYFNKSINTETVWARVETNNGCHRVSEINLIVSTTLIPDSFQRVFYECDDFFDTNNDERDGVTSFNFSSVTAEIESLYPIGQQLFIKYYRNEADALSEINPILDPSNYRNIGYPNSQTIYIRVDSQLDNDCLGLGEHITLHVEPVPFANEVHIERQCDDNFDGVFPFDTSTIQTTVLNGQTGMIVEYFDEEGNNLPSPLPNPFFTNSQTVTIKISNPSSKDPDGFCFSETTLEFIVDKKPVAHLVPNIFECDDDSDGIIHVNTSTIEDSILNGQTGMLVSYFDQNGNSLPSPLPNPFSTGSQIITVKVENELNLSCSAETTIEFKVYPKPEFDLEESAIYCLNLPPIIISTFNPSGDYSYEWIDEMGNIVSSNPFAEISSAGNYTVIATSEDGCKSNPRVISIEASSIASLLIDDITIIDDSDNNSITISTNKLGVGDYEFALQKENDFKGFYQDEPYFEALSPGFYTIFIRDKNNCGVAELDVSVIGFPKFFTPNQDGFNDTWKVLGVNEFFYAASDIYIFDRFGKLITRVNPKGEGWDGNFKGKQLPSTDYWFSVKLIDNLGYIRIRKGHFSLIR